MALKIRELEKKDIEPVFAMCRAMFDEAPNYKGKTFSETKVRSLLTQIVISWISPLLGIVAENENGEIVAMLGATLHEEFMTEEKSSTDLVVYVAPEHRGGSLIVRLVKHYEAWAISKGVKPENINLGVGTGVETERTVRIFERLGFRIGAYTMVKERPGS